MNLKNLLLCCAIAATTVSSAQTVTIHGDNPGDIIPKEIYGQFAEHLGTCIYGGLWVGKDSKIPNQDGYRTDVLNALKELKVPVLRWPGGCFADEYHWMDGIGPKEKRPKMVNNNWGGTVEDNSFGTHEFFNLCELIGAEPYLSGNVGSGTVEELAKWVEYITSDGDSPMANLRRQNGREKSWNLKYLGVGNESWGCGGSMRPEYYSDLFRRYSTYCRNYDGHNLFKIASGASDYDYNWTKVLMDNAGGNMAGLSLHYYTVPGWTGSKGSATDFTKDQYYWTIGKCREIEDVLKKHIDIMDEKDPKNRVALLLDEWGTWWDEEPGTIKGHLFQQNSMRDAVVASTSLDIFHKYTRRLKMCNIAQIVNVLQSMILTKDEKMVLTPTYFVFKQYQVHQNATYIPTDVECETMDIKGANRHFDGKLPLVSATASKDKNGVYHVSLTNVSVDKEQTVTVNLEGIKATKAAGTILATSKIEDLNTFDQPNKVKNDTFKEIKIKNGQMQVKMPKNSIVTLELK
ncbi:MAG: alpha-N-arabinofuranosidase [Prevotella sp.]|nr:alpha-N-arabinofuranosidase [Prevotella sp.]